MPISQFITLSKPEGTTAVPRSTLVYFRARFKRRIFGAILTEFKRSGLSKADLARRLNKEPAQISRLLSGPGNITLDTVSDVLFAASGSELTATVDYPLMKNTELVNKYAEPISVASDNQNILHNLHKVIDVEYCEIVT